MRTSVLSVLAALLIIAGAAMSSPAVSATARDALGGLTSADDAVTHDNGAVSICKGGKFPGCKGGRAFYCPVGGECTETPQSFVAPTGSDHATGAVLERGPGEPALFEIEFVNAGRLQNVCLQVKGDFQRTRTSHSCTNAACAKSDMACIVRCADGKCVGGMPDKSSGPVTLLGILQNGDTINRSGSPVSGGGDSGGNSRGDGGGDGGPEEPECGIGGCGPIL